MKPYTGFFQQLSSMNVLNNNYRVRKMMNCYDKMPEINAKFSKFHFFSIMKKFSVAILFLVVSGLLFAQSPPVEWGKVRQSDLLLEVYPPDKDANAVVLSDYGNAGFEMINRKYQIVFDYHQRVKILRQGGLVKANVEIYLNKSKSEQIFNLEAQSISFNYNDSTVQVTELEKGDFYRENVDDEWEKIIFTVPGARVGSVIEYRFKKISSDFFNYTGWRFHQDIPVIWSEFRVQLEGIYNYGVLLKNIDTLFINEKKNTFEVVPSEIVGGRSYPRPVRIPAVKGRYVMTAIPAMKPEPFMTTLSDYVAEIDLQLYSISYPFSPVRKVIDTWKGLAMGYLSDERVVQYTDPDRKIKKMVSQLTSGMENDSLKAFTIFDYIRKNFIWNENFRLMPASGLKELLKSREGNSAEINWILISFLRAAGLKAVPVLISTRENGKIQKKYPLLNQFNHVLVQVRLNNKNLLLDGLSPYLAFGQLHQSSLNHEGFAIVPGNYEWIEIACSDISEKEITATFHFDSSGYLSGYMIYQFTGYYASEQRKKFSGMDSTRFEREFLDNLLPGIISSELKLEYVDIPEHPLRIILKFITNAYRDKIKAENDLLYFDAVFFNHFDTNPFVPEKRYFPVDFAFPFSQNFRFIIEIPEGYYIEESPGQAKYVLEDSSARYIFLSGNTEEVAQVSSTITIYEPVFHPSKYHDLRILFTLIVNKQDEMITAVKEKD